jgi:ATP-dependent DNA helicase DinG
MLEDAETAAKPEAGSKNTPDAVLDSLVWEIRSVVKRLESAGSVCGSFLEYRENPNDVYWMERQSGKDPWAVLSATPVDVAPYLRDALFDANKTVICLSATLTIADSSGSHSFAYWAGRCGASIAGRELLSGIFPSPFPYASRTLLAVPSDAASPESGDYQDFVNRAVASLAAASGGSALVLFTSYQSLRSAYQASASRLEAQGIRCLKQGDDDRSRLLADFLADESSVLFATDSFWEGVDAPGDTLRLVILCRLPFRTPKEPVFEARRELLEKRGGNPFMELSLPDAVMKFKQGFGRLMRRSSDHGAVAVLDSRILRKFYGQAFIRSLPETKTSFKEFDSVVRDVERFLFS